jgi:hypothetical protein
MSIYRIAEHVLVITISKRENLKAIPGFFRFQLKKENPDEAVLLRFDTCAPLCNRTIEPQYEFMVGPYVCDFSGCKDLYLFRIALPGNNKPWLVEIHPDGEVFRAFGNLNSATPDDVLRFALWLAFGVAALHRQTVAVHASTVMYGGKSVLFLGESGTGKSTHTQLWLRHIRDTELLNDDSPFLNVGNDICVHGSPWSGKTPCYKALQTPVVALVRLRKAPFNRIKRLSRLEAIGAVLPSLPAVFAYDKTLSGYMHDILSKLLQQTPVYLLDCLPDAAAAKLAFDTLHTDGRI